MDDFLERFEVLGGKMKPVLKGETPAEKLDTIRKELLVEGDKESQKESVTRKTRTKGEEYVPWVEEKDDKERWDCETILCEWADTEDAKSACSDCDGNSYL
jgi:protein LTV1